MGTSEYRSRRFDLVVVANRLPIDAVLAEDGVSIRDWTTSPGGLVSSLLPALRNRNACWLGWPGVADVVFEDRELSGIHLRGIQLSQDEYSAYYEGVSNATLWPLYHDAIVQPRFIPEEWEAYFAVNKRFAQRAANLVSSGGCVWVHDYQLQLVPAMLKQLRPDVRVGYFHHIPFPPVALFAQLPWREQIVEGLLGADVVGFQRSRDVQNFMAAATGVPQCTRSGRVLTVHSQQAQHFVLVREFPISVDVHHLRDLARTPSVQLRAEQIRSELGNPRHLLLGVDRLDYTKGIRHRIRAVALAFESGDFDIESTVFLQIATPSRERIDAYAELRDDVELMIGRFVGDHGTFARQPIRYIHRSFDQHEMAALYRAADVMVVSALRDGMNLVAKEFVTCARDDAVLVLSEFAGAADELRDALMVNPHDIESLRQMLIWSIQIPEDDRLQRMRLMRDVLARNTIDDWSQRMLLALGEDVPIPPGLTPSLENDIESFAQHPRVLLALDFDGTSATIVDHPSQAVLHPNVAGQLDRLQDCADIRLAFVSGRALADLRQKCSHYSDAWLVGSHGTEVMHASESDRPIELLESERGTLRLIRETLSMISANYPGSWVEQKPTSMVLHTRVLPQDSSNEVMRVAREALDLAFGSAARSLTVRTGHRVLECSIWSHTKGEAVRRVAAMESADAVVYFGDDTTDEDVFQDLGDLDVGVKVGHGVSLARHRVAGVEDVARVLQRFVDARLQRNTR